MTRPRFSHNRIVFGEGPDRWSITDPESKALHEAAHNARYSPKLLTEDECMLLASAVNDYHYLATGATWYSITTAVLKIRDIIIANRDKSGEDDETD